MMFKRGFLGFAAVVLATAGLLLLPETSHAQRRGGGLRGGGWGGSRGGWGGYGGYGGSYGRGWGYGGLGYGGLYLGSYAPGYYGSGYGYGYPSYGYSSYSYPSYSSYSPGYAYAAPATTYDGVQSYQSFYPPADTSAAQDDTVHMLVRVPDANAQVWFEGAQTQQTGATREFQSPALAPGQDYVYHVRARWNDNGQMRDETRSVTVRAGQWSTVDFSRPDNSAATVNNPPSTQARPAVNTTQPPATPAVNPPANPNPPAERQPPSSAVTPPNGDRVVPAPAANPEIGPTGRVNNPKQ